MKAVKGVADAALNFVPGGSLVKGGLALAGGLLGGQSKPSQINTPQSMAGGAFSDLLRQGMGGQDIMSQMLGGFSLPGYGGSFGAGVTPEMLQAITGGSNAFSQFMSGDQGASAINALSQIAGGGQGFAPAGMQNFLQNLPGSSALAGIAGGQNPIMQQLLALTGGAQNFSNPFIQQLAGAGQVATPERQMLLQAAGMDPTRGGMQALGGAQDIIGSLMSTPALQSLMSGGGFDPASIFASLDTQRRAGLERDERDIRESLSSSGLRFSTNLADIFQQGRNTSESNMMAEIARLMPQYGQTQQAGMGMGIDALLRAAQGMTGVGQTAGQLGLGRQQNVLSGLGSAGELGLGAGGMNVDALIAAMQGQQGQNQLGLSSTGQSANILTQLLGQQAGAAGQLGQQGIAGQDILARLFGGQQQNMLGAATALPGAIGQMANLPMGLAQQLFNLSGGAQSINDQLATRQYTDFLNQRQMLPGIFNLLGGMPSPAIGPSGFDKTMSGTTDILTLIETLRNMGQ